MCWPDGRPYGGGPAGWCAAALVSAMAEGLAGIEDASTCFREAVVSPRWCAAGVAHADIVVAYPASGARFNYRYESAVGRISVTCSGDGERLRIHLLLPEGSEIVSAWWNGEPIQYTVSKVEGSVYLDADGLSQNGTLELSLRG